MLKRFSTNDYLIRIPLFIIFFWFGILKVLDVSPATELIIDTVFWMPFLSAKTWSIVIGYWEMAIGICFLNKKQTMDFANNVVNNGIKDFHGSNFEIRNENFIKVNFGQILFFNG